MKKILSLLIFNCVLISCYSTETNPTTSVVVNLNVVSSGQDVFIGASGYSDDEGTPYAVSKLQILFSELKLSASISNGANLHGGSSYPSSSTSNHVVAENHFFDLSDTSTHQITDTFLFDGVIFQSMFITFGLSAADNTTGSLPSEIAYNNFAWPAMNGGGYHYMKFEGSYEDGGSQSYVLHVGPTQGVDYSFTISVPVKMVIVNNTMTINIDMDLNGWFSGPNNFAFNTIPSMIMMNSEAQATIQENGSHGVFSNASENNLH